MDERYGELSEAIRAAASAALGGMPIEDVIVRPYYDPDDPLARLIDVTVRVAMNERPVPRDVATRITNVVFDAVEARELDVFPYVFCKFAVEQDIEAA